MGKRIAIYLTNLGRYNEGCLIGEWVKLPIDKDKLQEVLDRIGINEQYEEYFISDYETLFANLHISEYTDCILKVKSLYNFPLLRSAAQAAIKD